MQEGEHQLPGEIGRHEEEQSIQSDYQQYGNVDVSEHQQYQSNYERRQGHKEEVDAL